MGTRTVLPVRPPTAFLPAHGAAVPLEYARLPAHRIVRMKSAAAAVAPVGGSDCLAGAYFGWACPNKHSETLQPQLRASPWLTSHPVTPPLAERENKRGRKRQAARAKACRGQEGQALLIIRAGSFPRLQASGEQPPASLLPERVWVTLRRWSPWREGRGSVERGEGLFNKLPCKDVSFHSGRVDGMQNAFSSFNLRLAEQEGKRARLLFDS